MSSNRYFGDDIATFSVEIDSTTVTAGKVKDVSITASGEHTNLFSADSVKRQEVKRSEVTIDVEFTVVEFNEELAQYWLQGDSSTTSTNINDDSNVAQFDVTIEQNMTDHSGESGDESLKAVVNGVDFPEMPILELAEGEFNEHSFSGTGTGVTVTKESVA
jgi:hypothetical protein